MIDLGCSLFSLLFVPPKPLADGVARFAVVDPPAPVMLVERDLADALPNGRIAAFASHCCAPSGAPFVHQMCTNQLQHRREIRCKSLWLNDLQQGVSQRGVKCGEGGILRIHYVHFSCA